MTTKIKGYPFEVAMVVKPASVVLSDQVRSLDWRVRSTKLKGKVSAKELEAVRQLTGELRKAGNPEHFDVVRHVLSGFPACVVGSTPDARGR